MIISIGEILADLVGETNGGLSFDAHCGGAPFNLAVNAKRAGAKVGFIGRVGNDCIGKFLISSAEKANLDSLDIQIDDERNTTLAFVTLLSGERDFSFYRHDTADFHIDTDEIDFKNVSNLNIVHLGSLMLSESYGRSIALEIIKKVKQSGALLSFDVNFRNDLYKNSNEMFAVYKPFIEAADILKFSQDELCDYTGISDLHAAVRSVNKSNDLIIVTKGSEGSAYFYGDAYGEVQSVHVREAVDSTGAGDAFFGTFLAKIENQSFTRQNIEKALRCANEAGAKTVTFKGAIQL